MRPRVAVNVREAGTFYPRRTAQTGASRAAGYAAARAQTRPEAIGLSFVEDRHARLLLGRAHTSKQNPEAVTTARLDHFHSIPSMTTLQGRM
jgi:hypothetical protein